MAAFLVALLSPAQSRGAGHASPAKTVSLATALFNDGSTFGWFSSPLGIGPPLSVTPTNLNFGAVDVGQSNTLTLQLENVGNVTLNGSVSVGGSAFSIQGNPFPLGVGQTAYVNVTFSPTTGPGTFTGSVVFATDAGDVTVAISGTVPPGQLTVTPTNVNFGSVNEGQSSTQTIQIENTGGATITGNVSVGGSSFSIQGNPFPLGPGQTAYVYATFSPTTGPGTFTNSVVFTTDAGDVTVPVSGVVPPGQITVTPTNVNFGIVSIGQSNTQPLQVYNSGGVAVTGNMSVTGSSFSIQGNPFPLGPGQTAYVYATFSPTTGPGAFTGSAAFTTDAGDVTIPMSGSATLQTSLTIRTAGNQALIAWPGALTNSVVEAVTNLALTNWAAVTNAPALSNSQFVVTVDLTGGARFFRLRTP